MSHCSSWKLFLMLWLQFLWCTDLASGLKTQELLLSAQGCREGSLSLAQRPERPAMPNQDKLGPWPVMWEYQVATPLCWLTQTMHVGSIMCLCVCFLLWSDFSFRMVFIHLLSAPQLSYVWLSVYMARCCLFGLNPSCICYFATCPWLSSPAEVLLCLQLLFSMAQTQEMALIYVKSHDFLKQLVEGLAQNKSEVIRQGKSNKYSMCI